MSGRLTLFSLWYFLYRIKIKPSALCACLSTRWQSLYQLNLALYCQTLPMIHLCAIQNLTFIMSTSSYQWCWHIKCGFISIAVEYVCAVCATLHTLLWGGECFSTSALMHCGRSSPAVAKNIKAESSMSHHYSFPLRSDTTDLYQTEKAHHGFSEAESLP